MKFTVVKQEDRLDFFPKLVAMDMVTLMMFENSLYAAISEATDSYAGGMWEFIIFENGAMAAVLLDTEETEFELNKDFDCGTTVQVNLQQNYYGGRMSLFSLSLAVNMLQCSRLSFTKRKSAIALGTNYHLLREALHEYPEYSEIHSFLD